MRRSRKQEASPTLPIHTLGGSPNDIFPFVVTTFSEADSTARAEFPHRHRFYQILYITHGDGVHLIDFEPHPLQPPTLHCLAPAQVHFWHTTTPPQGYIVLFMEEFLALPFSTQRPVQELFQRFEQANVIAVAQADAPLVNGLMQALEQEYHTTAFSRVSVLQAYLHILLVHIQRFAMALHPDPPLTAGVAIVREFRRLVSLHSATERSIRVYAQKIGITTSHLCDTVKAVTGSTPGQILRQAVVLEAKRLLANTDLTVAEIGYRLNFKDPAYFGRFFRREAHTSPSAFRQEIRKKYHILPK